jgi:hypothetical protein
VYSEKLLMTDRGTVQNVEFNSKNKFEKSVHLVGFIIGYWEYILKNEYYCSLECDIRQPGRFLGNIGTFIPNGLCGATTEQMITSIVTAV